MGSAGMKTLRHPGPVLEPRRLALWAQGGCDLRIALPAGADLMEGLVAALCGHGVESAGLVILGGSLARISFMTGRPDDSGKRAATHNGPWDLEGPLTLVGGGAIFGPDQAGRPLLHCHALISGPDGRVRGGHLRQGFCPLGPEGLLVLAQSLQGAAFQVAQDPETNFPIFHPATADGGVLQ